MNKIIQTYFKWELPIFISDIEVALESVKNLNKDTENAVQINQFDYG